MSRIDILSISCEISIIWMPENLTDNKWTLVRIKAVCSQAPSHYLSQWLLKYMSSYYWADDIQHGHGDVARCVNLQMVNYLVRMSVLNTSLFWHLDWGLILGNRWKSSSVNFTGNVKGSDMVDIINTKTQTITKPCACMMRLFSICN